MPVLHCQKQNNLSPAKVTNQPILHIVGLSQRAKQDFSEEIHALVARHKVFAGGIRHAEIMRDLLPDDHQWLVIKGDMPQLIKSLKQTKTDIVIFASGDPFFYGIGNTIQRLWPQATLRSYPYFNSLQLLCQRTQTNYNTLQTVSVHGRDWQALDKVLIEGHPLIGVLTDKIKSPNAIADRLLTYGFLQYDLLVGEDLDSESEKVSQLTLHDCQAQVFSALNCILLRRKKDAYVGNQRQLGIPDHLFSHLNGRPNMITKRAVRVNTLSALELYNKSVFWDIGTCTGSVAIEAKRLNPSLHVVAFEKRDECASIVDTNCKRFSSPGIKLVMGDFLALDHSEYPLPDVVFIGGHGGRLMDILHCIHQLAPHALVVINAVKTESSTVFKDTLQPLSYLIEEETLQVNSHNPIQLISARPQTVLS